MDFYIILIVLIACFLTLDLFCIFFRIFLTFLNILIF